MLPSLVENVITTMNLKLGSSDKTFVKSLFIPSAQIPHHQFPISPYPLVKLNKKEEDDILELGVKELKEFRAEFLFLSLNHKVLQQLPFRKTFQLQLEALLSVILGGSALALIND